MSYFINSKYDSFRNYFRPIAAAMEAFPNDNEVTGGIRGDCLSGLTGRCFRAGVGVVDLNLRTDRRCIQDAQPALLRRRTEGNLGFNLTDVEL